MNFTETRTKLGSEYIKSLLANPSKIDKSALVDPEFFAEENQRNAYKKIVHVFTRGLKPTPENLTESSFAGGWNISILDPFWCDTDAVRPPAEHFVPKMAEVTALDNASRMTQEAMLHFSAGNVVDGRKKLANALAAATIGSVKPFDMNDAVQAAVEGLLQNDSGVQLGWSTVDRNLRIRFGDLVVLGADTNVGKTSTLISWVINCLQNNVPCCHISLEDDCSDTGERYASQLSGLNQGKWQAGLSADDFNLLKASNFKLPWCGFYLPTADIDEVCAAIRIAAIGGTKVIALDYFQCLNINSRQSSETSKYNAILDKLCHVAKVSNIVLLLASQIKRDPTPRKSDKPRVVHLDDLASTSSLEKRAQAVVLLWRDQGIIKGELAKNKRGQSKLGLRVFRDRDTGAVYELLLNQTGPEPKDYE